MGTCPRERNCTARVGSCLWALCLLSCLWDTGEYKGQVREYSSFRRSVTISNQQLGTGSCSDEMLKNVFTFTLKCWAA